MIATALVAASSVAAADELHWQVEPSMRIGSVRLDGDSVGQVGGSIDIGARVHRLAFVLELAEMNVSATSGQLVAAERGMVPIDTPGSGGTMDRVGGAVRWYFAHHPGNSHDPIADAWVQAGIGRELFTWDIGGYLGRTDVAFEIGGDIGMVSDAWHEDRRGWWGAMALSLEIIYARRVDGVQPVSCGGPCDTPSRPAGYDRSIIGAMTIPFGK
jgi:hypothetical protein